MHDSTSLHVLIVDDDAGLRFTLSEILEAECEATTSGVASAAEALASEPARFDVILTDLMMPGELDGMGLLRELRARQITAPILMLTAHGSEQLAVEAMKQGAWDYIKKPFELDELILSVRRAAATRAMQKKLRHAAARSVLGGEGFIASSAPMRALLQTVERIAPRDITVLITGPTGSGKEVIGSLLHAYSARVDGPLVRFNCAALPADLAESELFGHEKGAFTGATHARKGYFERADGGTLILDEVGELGLEVQSKLLRACAQGEIQPVGGRTLREVDVRLVACTNRNLREAVRQGTFREDLYYRLAVIELEVPGLEQRRDEIPDLVAHFQRRYMHKFGIEQLQIKPEVIAFWKEQVWPGHVRELENAVARAIAMSTGEQLTLEQVHRHTRRATKREVAPSQETTHTDKNMSFRERMDNFERQLIEEAMREHGGHQTRAASALGMARTTLIDKLKRHGIYRTSGSRS